MRNQKTFWLAILVFLGAVLLTQAAYAATVTLRVGTAQASAGGTVEVPIEAVGAPGIGPMQMELVYDPAVLTAESVTRGALLSGNALMESNVTPRGRVIIAMVAADPIKGDGVVVKVRFKVIGSAGQQSALTLEAVKAWERGNQREVLVQTEAGKVTVAAVATDSSLWLFLCAACLCSFLLIASVGVLLWTRRRRAAPMPYTPPPSAVPMGSARPTDLPEHHAQPHSPQPAGSPKCRHCGYTNRSGAKFCDQCGKPLSS